MWVFNGIWKILKLFLISNYINSLLDHFNFFQIVWRVYNTKCFSRWSGKILWHFTDRENNWKTAIWSEKFIWNLSSPKWMESFEDHIKFSVFQPLWGEITKCIHSIPYKSNLFPEYISCLNQENFRLQFFFNGSLCHLLLFSTNLWGGNWVARLPRYRAISSWEKATLLMSFTYQKH